MSRVPSREGSIRSRRRRKKHLWWWEPGEPGSGAEGRSEADPHDELPKSVKIFEPAGDQSEAAGEAPPSALERLNENIEQLFETVDAVAADVAESRSHLERTTGSVSEDPEAANGADGIEERIRVSIGFEV